MYRRMLVVSILICALGIAPGCTPKESTTPAMTKAVLSLDWVPNTNHTGFYVAADMGWYAAEGIDLEIQIPSDPSAALKQVAYGNTEFGVSFQEEVTVARANDIPVVSLAAIVQHNTSAFASLAEAEITRARDMEGKRYASYGLPIERPILGELMACDGANIDQVEFIDVGFDAFPALVARRVHLAWIFLAWDGIQAELLGLDLNTLPLYGSCVPDYYTPVVVAGEKTIAEKPDLVRRFMKATARGYEYAIANPGLAVESLLRASPETDRVLVTRSQEWLSPRYQDDADRWGYQRAEVWSEFSEFMHSNRLVDKPIDPQKAFTNDFLP